MSSCGRSELRIFAVLTSENSDKAKLIHKAHSPGPMGYPSGNHSTFGGYYRFLMYIGPRTFDVLHKKICCIDRGEANRTGVIQDPASEVRRILLLRHWVNREQEGLEPRRGISTLPCPLLLRTHDHDRAVSVVDHGGGDASHQCSSHPAQAPASHDYEPST
jgi:hypothetical protein